MVKDSVFQAFSMYLRGHEVSVIAKEVGASEPTVRGWISSRKEEVKKHLEEIKGEDYVGIVLGRFKEMRDLIWMEFEKAKYASDKARFVKLLLDIQKQEISTLQDLGALKKAVAPVPHEHKHEVTGTVAHAHAHAMLPETLDGAELESLAAMLIADTMGLTPEQALKLGGRFSDPSRPYLIKEDDPRIIDVLGDDSEKEEDFDDLDFSGKEPLLINPLESLDKVD